MFLLRWHRLFPSLVHFREEFGSRVVVGGARVVGLCGSEFFQTTTCSLVVGIGAQHAFVVTFRLIIFAQVVFALRHVEIPADLIDLLSMFVGQRGIGADGIVAVIERFLEFVPFHHGRLPPNHLALGEIGVRVGSLRCSRRDRKCVTGESRIGGGTFTVPLFGFAFGI